MPKKDKIRLKEMKEIHICVPDDGFQLLKAEKAKFGTWRDFLLSCTKIKKEETMTEINIEALEKALSKKEKVKKAPQEPKAKRQRSDKPLFIPVDKEGKEVKPEDIKMGKTYGLK